MSHLSANEASEFFGVWLPLLSYVNKRRGIFPELESMTVGARMVPKIAGEIAGQLWEDVSLIDDYIEERPELTEGERVLLSSWKRAKRDNFIFERQLRDGAVFINQDKEVYLVKGTSVAFESLVTGRVLPVALTATLIPFRDVIITDGLLGLMDISYGEDLKREFRMIYEEARKGDKIIKSF